MQPDTTPDLDEGAAMTTWSKTPPSEPGWYWVELGRDLSVRKVDGDLWGRADARFGPRIPSPEAIEAAKDALRDVDSAYGVVDYDLRKRCRAALAKLEGR